MNKVAKVVSFDVPPVVKAVTVRCAPAVAFRRFTQEVNAWWPLATHHVGAEPERCAFEGRVGGRLYQRDAAGLETAWGIVEQWDPPRRIVFTWQACLPDDQAQRIEVTFTPAAGGATRVELVHSGWEKLGEAAAAKRDSYDKGWGAVFERSFAPYADRAAD